MVSLLETSTSAKRAFLRSPVRENRTPGSARGHSGQPGALPQYIPLLGRWPSKDPIEESGGVNLFNAFENAPTNSMDFLGLVKTPCNRKSKVGHHIVPYSLYSHCCGTSAACKFLQSLDAVLTGKGYNLHGKQPYDDVKEKLYRETVTAVVKFVERGLGVDICKMNDKQVRSLLKKVKISKRGKGVIQTYNRAVRKEIKDQLAKIAAKKALEEGTEKVGEKLGTKALVKVGLKGLGKISPHVGAADLGNDIANVFNAAIIDQPFSDAEGSPTWSELISEQIYLEYPGFIDWLNGN
jgi:hypothetical protein